MGAPKTLAEMVGGYADAQIAVLLDNDGPLNHGQLDAIHPTRVAIRRLRSTLHTFDIYQRTAADDLGAELRWFGAILGRVRDLDVQSRRLTIALRDVEDWSSAAAARSALDDVSAARARAAWVQVGVALGSTWYDRLRTMLADWAADPPLRKRAHRPATEAARYVDDADHTLRQRLAHAIAAATAGTDDAPRLAHAARRAGKRHRYAAELALPVLGAAGTRLVEQRAELQDVLGEQQDAIVAHDFIAEVAATAADAARPALDAVLRREEQIIADAEHLLASL